VAEPDEQGMKSWEGRGHEALKRRWRTISRDVRKFMPFYRQAYSVHRTGGTKMMTSNIRRLNSSDVPTQVMFQFSHRLLPWSGNPNYSSHKTAQESKGHKDQVASKANNKGNKPSPVPTAISKGKANRAATAMGTNLQRSNGSKNRK
jgi:hypothetical protein